VHQSSVHGSVHIIVNSGAGGVAASGSPDAFKNLILRVLPNATMDFTDGSSDLASLARNAMKRGHTMIVAAGGDGTTSTVAAALIDSETVLGVLPAGTMNHFCKDLGIPVNLEAAIQNLAKGRVISVDAGDVNGRIFINNCGLGLYPSIVRLREKQQAQGKSKWTAAAGAAIRALIRYRRLTVRVKANGKELIRRTPILFIGNNDYVMEGLNIGSRARLDGGLLCLYMPREIDRLKLLGFSLSALLGRLQKDKDYDKVQSPELWIRSRGRGVHISLDGEVLHMASALHFRIRPKALRVLVPESGH
jgi:diacylglycerol kinase family enzyme